MSTGSRTSVMQRAASTGLRSLLATAVCCALGISSALAGELGGYGQPGGLAGEVQGVPVGTLTGTLTGSAPAARPDDPVYDAWEEFLKRRGPAQALPVQALPVQGAVGAATLPQLPSQALLANVAQDQVLAPEATQGTSLTATLMQGGLSSDSFPGGFLATVLGGVGLAGVYAARKRAPKLAEWLKTHTAGGKNPNRVRVLSVSPLSAQGSLAVVEVGGQTLVLGVTSGRVSLLTRLDQNGMPMATPALEKELDEPEMPVVAKEAPKAAPAVRSAVAQDFSALLSNLTKESTEAGPNPNSPLARYAAMNALKKETSVEPPSEDMATQVLRKMKTMKRFRSAA